MSLELTRRDVKSAEALLRRLERRSRRWKWIRWYLLLVYSLPLVLAIVAVATFYPLLRDHENDFARSMTEETEVTNPTLIRWEAEHAASLWGSSAFYFALATMLGTSGIILLIFTVNNWNRHVYDLLLAKALRAQIASPPRSDDTITT
ncbi:hypothetical protein LCGC14_2310150 [marine sediment metagenome]|uniref:Uncharacterized protein n=1 Tax=marine sediment metagenome TaxID=412755 RepID=A0A0F9CLD7_9ZZZZ